MSFRLTERHAEYLVARGNGNRNKGLEVVIEDAIAHEAVAVPGGPVAADTGGGEGG